MKFEAEGKTLEFFRKLLKEQSRKLAREHGLENVKELIPKVYADGSAKAGVLFVFTHNSESPYIYVTETTVEVNEAALREFLGKSGKVVDDSEDDGPVPCEVAEEIYRKCELRILEYVI